jgi:hypothetical protein
MQVRFLPTTSLHIQTYLTKFGYIRESILVTSISSMFLYVLNEQQVLLECQQVKSRYSVFFEGTV